MFDILFVGDDILGVPRANAVRPYGVNCYHKIIACRGRVSFASKVNATTSYTRWDNMVLGTVKNDDVVLDSLKVGGETVENFYNTITQYDVKLDAAATITATAPEGCTVVIDKETVPYFGRCYSA